MSSPITCPVSRLALQDFLLDAFQISSNDKVPAVEILVEHYLAKGGKFSVQELALMAGNVCPDTGKMYEQPANIRRNGGWPKDPIFPYQKLKIIVKNVMGWEPAEFNS